MSFKIRSIEKDKSPGTCMSLSSWSCCKLKKEVTNWVSHPFHRATRKVPSSVGILKQKRTTTVTWKAEKHFQSLYILL